jgi:hypothetical protein
MITEIELFESTDLTPLHFCLWGCMKSEVYKRKVDTRDASLARILDVATRMKERESLLDFLKVIITAIVCLASVIDC